MERASRRWIAGLAFASWALVATVAGAQPEGEPAAEDPGVAEARRHYAQGVVFFRAQRYEEANAEFLEAFQRWQTPTILYSLGQTNERLLRVTRAIDYYRQYLQSAPADAPNRQAAEDAIRGLSALLSEVTFASNVPATIFANGEEVGRSPGVIQLATGRFEIELRAPGYEPARQTLVLAGRVSRTVRFDLARVRVTTRQVVVRERSGLSPTWFWTGVALTGASAVAAAVFGALTLDRHSSFADDPLPTSGAKSEGERFAALTDVFVGSAAVFGAVSFVLLLNTHWGDDRPAATASLAVTTQGFALTAGGVF